MEKPPALETLRAGLKGLGKPPVSARLAGWRLLAGLALAVLVSAAGYLLASRQVYQIGFPLDDAWIHQTYARNLALRGEWAFLPGQPSAGSTAPLWSALLAAGYWLRVGPLAWAFLLGGLSLLGLAWAGVSLFRAWLPQRTRWAPWAGLFLVGEWHLAWAAVSGMETLLSALLVLLVLWRVSKARGTAWVWAGLLIGLSVWVRPDGITLLGPALFTLVLVERSWSERLRGVGWLTAGLALFFLPYLLFNLEIQGSLWPNTFYAKQAEYAALRQSPLLLRFIKEISLPLVGSGLFLLPGFGAFCLRVVRRRDWPALASVIWFLGYGLLYAMRLPVAYQYGRYFMPAMPVFFVTGLVGTAQLLERMPSVLERGRRAAWLLSRVGLLSAAALWAAFYFVGAGRYAQDVAIIETEMVASARWVAANTPPDALIAAHDIGALGYFGQRQLIDLAGLVSPEVIPFIRDEARLAGWLDEKQVDYLVILKDWYAHLADGKDLVYQTGGSFAPNSGGSNIIVYRWKP